MTTSLPRLALAMAVTLAPVSAHADSPPVRAWEIEYTLTGKLRITDTMLGAGNGVHDVGPGKIVLRFEDVGGEPAGAVKVMSYELDMRFTVNAYVLGLGTTVTNETKTTADTVEGVLGPDRVIRWSGPWSGVSTEGHLTCSGSMCGKFSAPPRGKSPYHVASHAQTFKPFLLSPDKKSLHMDYVVMSKSSSHTANLMLEGRETRRSSVCVARCT
jgi:hypothetical protein